MLDMKPCTRVMSVATFFSGTDSPILALKQIAGSEEFDKYYDHCVSVDHATSSQEFVMRNMAPRHFYSDSSSISAGAAHCL
eukprot:10607716-Alexandrium_andersonii.AAC.1